MQVRREVIATRSKVTDYTQASGDCVEQRAVFQASMRAKHSMAGSWKYWFVLLLDGFVVAISLAILHRASAHLFHQ
jgi:hypothetical protein